MRNMILGSLLLAMAPSCAKTTHSDLESRRNEDVEAYYRDVVKFADECGLAKMTNVSRQSIQKLPTFTDLANLSQSKVKQFINTSGMREDEIFGASNHGFWREHFALASYSLERRASCHARMNRMKNSYDLIAGVVARNDAAETAYTYALAKQFGGTKVVFFISSKAMPDADQVRTFGEGVDGEQETEIRHLVITLSDAQLVQGLTAGDLRLDTHDIAQLALARELLVAKDSYIAEVVAQSDGIHPGSGWRLIKGVSRTTGKEVLLVKYDDIDDNSYSFFFHPRSTKLNYIYYEN